MNFKSWTKSITKHLIAVAVCIAGAVGCTEVNYDLGYDFIPESQRMTLHFDTLTGVKTYLYRYDSVLSSNTGYVFLGKVADQTFGKRTNSCLVQYLPVSIPYKGGFGINPIIDSLYLRVAIASYNGDTTIDQKFNIYAINKDSGLNYDSLYYTNLDVEEYYKPENLLFTFNYKGKSNIATKLEPTTLGRELMQQLISVDTAVYNNDSLWRKNFAGFYITPDPTSPNAATYQFALDDAYMQLWLRDHDSIDQAKIKDTLTAWYYFYDGEEYASLSVNLADYDYEGSTLGELQTQTNNFTDTVMVQPTIYVQTWGGVISRLRFPDELVDALNELKYTTNEDGTRIEHSVMINQAMLYVEMKEWVEGDMTTVDYMNAAPNRLGSYLNMRSSGTEGYTPSPIPDYLYDYEKNYQISDENYVLPYNGYLNRSNGYYELNISSYIQQIMKGTMKKDILLGPSGYDFFGYGHVALQGAGARPMKLSMTYTLIKK
ncbi:MAG: DUF4270 family protein [Rikenellaceae bacterium]|nr:DUF4270 family protein [Rikenellaceae bacterium]